MSRVQLALNVSNLEEAVAFYSALFDAPPSKRRPGYANFAVEEPPLKLVLIENPGAAGTLNHLGVEVTTVEDVTAAHERLASAGLATAAESGACCYAVQEKVWVADPDAAPWEIYTVLGDSDVPHAGVADETTGVCCSGTGATTAAATDEGAALVRPCC